MKAIGQKQACMIERKAMRYLVILSWLPHPPLYTILMAIPTVKLETAIAHKIKKGRLAMMYLPEIVPVVGRSLVDGQPWAGKWRSKGHGRR